MIKAVMIPDAVRAGIRPRADQYKDAEIWGADFETVRGQPYTIQITHPGGDYFSFLERPGDGLEHFLDVVEDRGAPLVRCYFWGLFYDGPCLFFDALSFFRQRDFKIECRYRGRKVSVSMSCDRSWFGTIKWGKKYTIRLLDGCQFFRQSLDKCSKMLGNVKKYSQPRGLGERKLTSPAFVKYAKRDARLTYNIALVIEKEHRTEGISSCVSASQFASKVFRSNYLKNTIEYCLGAVEKAGMLSYHGGLNWVTPDAPKLFRKVTEYDISSAYPEAFNQLPDFSAPHGRWVRHKNRIERHGFVKIRFRGQCRFFGVRGHSFECIRHGTVWTTTYEYKSSKRCFDSARVLDGWYWQGGGVSPFREYMNEFYKRKQDAPNKVKEKFAKICLNGLYGKLIQNRENDNGVFVAGGMFNPALGSLVTGYTRARMHSLLHTWEGIHCATDSIFTRSQDVPVGSGIGQLERGTTGDLLLLRNKLYVFFKCGTEEIIKWGAHGFWGKPKDLIRLWKKRSRKYKVKHMFKVREAFIQGKTPLAMERVKRTLGICWDAYVEEQAEIGSV